jgi:hypothetical protein
MAEDLDRRLREMFVVVGRTRFAEVLEQPGIFFAGLDVCLGLDAGDFAELAETEVRPAGGPVPSVFRATYSSSKDMNRLLVRGP